MTEIRSGRRVSGEELISALAQCGPMATEELALLFGVPSKLIGGYVSAVRGRSKRHGQRIYVHDWRRESEAGGTDHLRAVWAAGARPDKPKPPALSNAELQRRCKARKRLPKSVSRVVPNSVFQLGALAGVGQ